MEIEINDENFKKEVLESSLPVMVDFWATWCAPCSMIAPVVKEIADDYAGKLKVCKFNVDEGQSTAIQYGVINIPTLVFFKNGEAVDNIVGIVPKSAIEEKIKQKLGI